jgi:peptidyl-prolyl cis-trans isomerase SurA
MAPALRQYLTKLREQAYIEIDTKDGYEDSAATTNETQPTTTYSAYVPPIKKKKHVERTRFRQKGPKKQPQTQTASTPAPANAPSLAQVPGAATAEANGQQPAAAQPATAPAQKNTQTASVGVEKPGKKEKIRFGQAPRETLPYAPTKTEDAGAGTETATNVAQNVQVVGPNGEVENQQPQEKKEKSRFSDRARLPKQKKSKDKTDPFAPAPETTDEQATRQAQSAPLGLNGDTSKPKKEKPTGKTRLSDKAKEKSTDQQQGQTQPAQQPTLPSSQQQ